MKILMCTGGSKFAERAVDLSANLLDEEDDITLFYVKEKGVNGDTVSKCRDILEKHALAAKIKVKDNRYGVASEILKESQENYDLIVMGSLGVTSISHGSFHRFILGMNAFRVVENAKKSVLIARGTSSLKRILVSVSGSRHDYEIAEFACSLVRSHAEKVKFLRVIPEFSKHFKVFIPPNVRDSMRELLEDEVFERPEKECLDRCVKIAEKYNIPTIKTKLREGDAAAQILHEAEEGGYDLIVIGARKSHKFPLGDTAHRIVNYSRCSFLVVRK